MNKHFYITRWALTRGIIGRYCTIEEEYPGLITLCSGEFDGGIWYMKIGIDAFEKLEHAKIDAEHRRVKKIKSLEKQIERLKLLKF